MAQYITFVQATSNSAANTEDTFILLTGAASTSFFLKRVRISTNTPNSDVDVTGRICLLSAAGSTGTSGTIVKKRPLAPSATTTSTVKNGTTAYTVGSVTSSYDQVNVNGRAIWEWIPRGNEEYIDSGSAGLVSIVVKVSAASVILNVTAEWEE